MDKNDLLVEMVLKHEGGYSSGTDKHSSGDNGKETYCGISRRSHPRWSGWKIVDTYKPLKWNEKIDDAELNQCVIDLYTKNYYKPLKLESINNLLLSAHLFDHGVNAGLSASAKLLQKSINTVYNVSIAVDGKIGNETLSYVNSPDKLTELVNEFIKNRNQFYKNIVNRNPSQSKFLNGWLNRVKTTTKAIQNYQKGFTKEEQNVCIADGTFLEPNKPIWLRILEFIWKMIQMFLLKRRR